MKVPFSCGAVLALTSLTSLASAKLDLTFPFSSVTAGETYELGWMQDANYTLELLLIRDDNGQGWSPVDKLWDNKKSSPPGGAYNWTVGKKYKHGSGYGLYLSGDDRPYHGGGYANLTEWFSIAKGGSCEGEDE